MAPFCRGPLVSADVFTTADEGETFECPLGPVTTAGATSAVAVSLPAGRAVDPSLRGSGRLTPAAGNPRSAAGMPTDCEPNPTPPVRPGTAAALLLLGPVCAPCSSGMPAAHCGAYRLGTSISRQQRHSQRHTDEQRTCAQPGLRDPETRSR
mmetsp:Transcript_413/g.1221  ORF Transcript_413/g.1221 Transcript_413/m.1221 type:complete len:152 (-) Transcript_413:178-633(-)